MDENYSRISDWFKKSKPDSQLPDEPEIKESQASPNSDVEVVLSSGIEGVVTDQKLLSWYYRQFEKIDTQPVATDKFMDKSKNEYNASWLARELIQNFVDGNEDYPYTLDGVEITEEIIDKKTGMTRFTIRGNWKFDDPTGLTSLHSSKTDKRKTAGGNGIGLKQVALRYLRDFGIQNFEIQGEEWIVNYHLANKDEINQKLEDNRLPERLRHDWLLADIKHSKNQGHCTYTIDTNNPEVIKALQELSNLGVSETNTFLQNPDFKNDKGSLKWLPITEEARDPQGRLFINGQVMNFKNKGENSEDYWRGPELITIQLNDIDYKISIDRPPLNAYDLTRYVRELIQSMSEDELIDQLQKSEYIWSKLFDSAYGSDRKGCFIVIENIVSNLSYSSKYDNTSFAKYFGNKKYLCWDRGVNEHQIENLGKQGFIICPSYFEKIGMEKASSKLDSLEAASNEKPQSPQYKMEKIAEEHGFVVAHERIDVRDPEKFLQSIKNKLVINTTSIEKQEGRPNAFRLYLNIELPKELLFHQLTFPKTDEQKLLHYLRSIIFTGLEDRIFEKAFTSSGEYITTFSTYYDSVTGENNLLARNIKCNSDKGVFIEFELPQILIDKFNDNLATKPAGVQPDSKNTAQKKPTPIKELPKSGNDNIVSFPGQTVPAQISETRKKLNSVPVHQPEQPIITERKQKEIIKNMNLSEEDQARLAILEKKIPEIKEAIATLESVVPAKQEREKKGGAPDKYLQWRGSPDFYGQATQQANYLTGKHLLEIVAENNQADIAIALSSREKTDTERKMEKLNATLKEMANRLAAPEDQVDDFEIVLTPNEKQLAKIGILRAYIHLTTQVLLPNDFFIYSGTGSKGINIAQKAIGLHESLFETDFKEIFGVYVHEIAHNASMPHNVQFMHTMQSLFATINERLSQISEKLANKEDLDENELMTLKLKKKWDGI